MVEITSEFKQGAIIEFQPGGIASSEGDTGGFWKYKGLWSGTVALPTTAKTGWVYKFQFDCVVPYGGGDVTYLAGSMIVATTDNSGSVIDWYPIARG